MSTTTAALGHIFHTTAGDSFLVSVAIETGGRGGRVLAVRDCNGSPVVALPVAHVSRAILSTMFDATDTAAILARIAE